MSPTLGIVGLGTMGAALARNFAGKGVALALHDADAARTEALAAELRAHAAATPAELAATLAPPRAILLMVPAGEAVDAALGALASHLAAGDAVIDGGNSFWKDTERRVAAFGPRGVHVLGFGVSGGEDGARHGPAIMAGGDPGAVARVAPVLRAIAARAEDGEPCFVHAGPGGAGHFVKMTHNGVEYAVMQLIAEAYQMLRDLAGLDAAAIGAVFAGWRGTAADSFLLDCARRALAARDGDAALVDLIIDSAGQKGTGAWTTAAALELGVPAPTLAEAVFARGLSGLKAERVAAALAAPPATGIAGLADELGVAISTASRIAHAQGFALIAAASAAHGWKTDLAEIARGWRAGCILRSPVIDAIAAGLGEWPAPNLLAHRALAVGPFDEGVLRSAVIVAIENGIAVPALASALAYLDGYRTARSGANLIEAMRDVFGRHGFARIDRDGRHHAEWPPS